mmetsp:Transcript_45450/g.120542  ORF Transcript_45450/g.120542 Transcript_45450/m.120542 type:complete len:445 (-) Transcript_45450:76-1410(-)
MRRSYVSLEKVPPEHFDLRSITVVALATAVSDMSFSTIAPYYPSFAEQQRGVSVAHIGIIFSVTSILAFLVTPLAPRLIALVGSPLVCLQVATFGQAALNLLWAFTCQIETTWHFAVACFVLRAFQGVAMSCNETAAYSLAMRSASPARAGEALGYIEAARGVGLLMGPLAGGFLFELGGYIAPGAASAVIIFAGGLATFLVSTSAVAEEDISENFIGYRELLVVPKILANLVLVAVAMLALTFLDPTLAPYLEKPPYNLTSASVGVVFAFASIPYAICSVVVAPAAKKLGEHVSVVVGMIMMGGVFVLLGPSPLLPFLPQNVLFMCFVMVLMGISAAGIVVPGGTLMTVEASRMRGLDTNVPTETFSDSLSALTNMAFTGGSILGPLVAGLMTQFIDFQLSTTIFGFFVCGLAIVLTPVLCRQQSRKGLNKQLIDTRERGSTV